MEKQINDKRICLNNGVEDRISMLPDPLLCRILLNLPTKDVVKTSVLSTRWRFLWLSVSGLDLNNIEFPDYSSFVNFVNRFIRFSVESPIDKLKLTYKREECNPLDIKSWVDAAMKRKIQHLEINFEFVLLSIRDFICQTLVCLRLRYVAFNELNCVSLPRLKKMYLEEVRFANHLAIEKLIASCPVLEDLSIVRSQDDVKVLRVHSQTINRLHLVLDVIVTNHWDVTEDIDKWEVVIDAPRLEYLSLKDNKSTSFTINNLCSSAKVDIAVDFNVKYNYDLLDLARRSSIGNFLTKISNVKDMTICWKTLKVILQYQKLDLLREPLPQFYNMSQLHTKILAADLEMLPDFLENCPNLKSLVVELNGSIKKTHHIRFSFVPWCLRSCLESIEMKTPVRGIGVEMQLIRYFLENSTILKKFTLRLGCHRMKEESTIFMELLRFRRCSSACEVDVVGLEETLIKL